jgi:hypothetical protein
MWLQIKYGDVMKALTVLVYIAWLGVLAMLVWRVIDLNTTCVINSNLL